MPRLKIHDFRITDSILAQTDRDAGDIVFLGPSGTTAFPFVVWRKISGPGGVYVDAFEIAGPDGAVIGPWERSFEVDGESWPVDVVTEVRDWRFPAPGAYTLRYYEFDDKIFEVPFQVVQQDPPYGVVVPGPLDAALSKSTLCWLEVPQPDGAVAPFGIWFGYEDGRVYVLFGEGEQEVTGLDKARYVRLIARSKDVQSRIGEIDCAVQILPKDARWDSLVQDLLIGRRLNVRDPANASKRWREQCEIAMLTPVAAPLA
ncbi:MAG TPA: hypothetical protein VGB64_03775 [Actinomycetota bacterium]